MSQPDHLLKPELDRSLKIYDVGERVKIHSLVKASHLNDKLGRLMSFNYTNKRWSVHLLEANEKILAIKPSNLKPATECTSTTTELLHANRAPIMLQEEGKKEDESDPFAMKGGVPGQQPPPQPTQPEVVDANIISCSTCGKQQSKEFRLKLCTCRTKRYCNSQCQKKQYKQHKKECLRLVKDGKKKPETIKKGAGPNPFGERAVKERLTKLNIKSREQFLEGLKHIKEWEESKPSDWSPELLRLAKQLFHHGAVSQPRDMYPSGIGNGVYHAVRHGNAYECDEIATLISLPVKSFPTLVSLCSAVVDNNTGTESSNEFMNGVHEQVVEQENDTQRVFFVIGVSDQNTCDPGCWCTGAVSFELSYYLPDSVNSEHSHGSKDGSCFQPGCLLLVAYPNGGYWNNNMENVVFRGPNGTERGSKLEGPPSQFATDELAVALGIQSSEVGILARMIVVAANVLGIGRSHWQFVENLHNRTSNENENGVSQSNSVASVLYETPSLEPGQSLNRQLRFSHIYTTNCNPFQPEPPDEVDRIPKHRSASRSDYDNAVPETTLEATIRVEGGDAMRNFPHWNEIRGRTTLPRATTGGGQSPRFLANSVLERVCFDPSSKIASAIGLCNIVEALGDWQQKVLIGADIHEFLASIDQGNAVGTDCAGEEWSVCKIGHRTIMCRNCFSARTLESIAHRFPASIKKLAGCIMNIHANE